MMYLVVGILSFIGGIVLYSYFINKKFVDGYDKQAFNSDANLALNCLDKGQVEQAKKYLNRIIKRTGMGRRK